MRLLDDDRSVNNMILDSMKLKVANRKILDIGCGDGSWLPSFTDHKATLIIGVDISQHLLRRAIKSSKRSESSNIHMIVADAHYLPFKHSFFDVILCSLVLPYLKDELKALKGIKQVLSSNGELLLGIQHIGLYLKALLSDRKLYVPLVFIQTFFYQLFGFKIKKIFNNTFHTEKTLKNMLYLSGLKSVRTRCFIKYFGIVAISFVVARKR